MKILPKKEVLTQKQKQINDLKDELRYCETLMKRTEMLFEMATDENLIEARIYEMKSLSKHYDYLISSVRRLMQEDTDPQVINI
ncbi:MAG: hypothetical protein IJ410_04515 [Oscillospiraceae bacterium]|nr:hypothetical protein [Oscillospiraceae bacterium]